MNFVEFSRLTRIASAACELNIAKSPGHRWCPKWVPVLHHPLLASLLQSWAPREWNHPTVGPTLCWKKLFLGAFRRFKVGKIWFPAWKLLRDSANAKATPDPPTVSVSSSTNTQIDLAWTPGFVFWLNSEMGDSCVLFGWYLVVQFTYTLRHWEQYFVLLTSESKLKMNIKTYPQLLKVWNGRPSRAWRA